jgi:hypothetical protein
MCIRDLREGKSDPHVGGAKTSDDRLDQVMCQSGAFYISFRLNFSQEAPRKRSRRQQPYLSERAPDTIQDRNNGTRLAEAPLD